MPNKPHGFNEIAGHKSIVEFLQGHLENGTLPQFIIFEGDEGLGKSSLAKILAYHLTGNQELVAHRIIEENKSTEDVLLYNMSINGGKDVAKEVESNLTLGLSGFSTKVIICDEAHGMSDAAQDVFLVSTEYLPKGVYLFMCTTDSANLKPTLKSRAFSLHLNHLTNKEMVGLLKARVLERGLTIQAESSTLSMIAAWADGKPRIALNLLDGFGLGAHVSRDTIKEFIDYMVVDDILPLLATLSGSMTQGLSFISEMRLNSNMVMLLVEILKVHQGMASYKISLTDTHKIREQLDNVPHHTLVEFVYRVAGLPKLTRQGLISAYLQCHTSLKNLLNPPDRNEQYREEMNAKREAPRQEEFDETAPAAPSLHDLLQKGSVFGGE